MPTILDPESQQYADRFYLGRSTATLTDSGGVRRLRDGHPCGREVLVMAAAEAYRMVTGSGRELGQVARYSRPLPGGGSVNRWEATAGGNALFVQAPADRRVHAALAVLDNARRCGIVTGPTRYEFVPLVRVDTPSPGDVH